MRRFIRPVFAGLIAGALALVIAGPASAAYNPINCGTTAGNAKLWIEPISSKYQTRMENSNNRSYIQAGIRWRPPTSTVSATWYYGDFRKVGTAFSPQVSNINFPSQMYGYIEYSDDLHCKATVAASLYF